MDPQNLYEEFSKQIDRIDKKYTTSLDKIDLKIDRLVDVNQTVATLQERSVRQTEELHDLRTIVRANKDVTDEASKRIHMRIDDLQKDMSKYDGRIEDKINSVNSEMKKYIHVGVGLWIAASIFITALQWIGFEYVKAFREDFNGMKTSITTLGNSVRDLKYNQDFYFPDVKPRPKDE